MEFEFVIGMDIDMGIESKESVEAEDKLNSGGGGATYPLLGSNVGE